MGPWIVVAGRQEKDETLVALVVVKSIVRSCWYVVGDNHRLPLQAADSCPSRLVWEGKSLAHAVQLSNWRLVRSPAMAPGSGVRRPPAARYAEAILERSSMSP